MKRLTIAVWVAVTLALVLAACGRFPTSGPIETVGDGGSGERPTGIDVAAQPPSDGASPEAILEGFFAASESPADGYAVARQYLTDQAASSWRPEDGINIYDSSGQSRVITADGSAVVRASLVGRLGSDHVFTAVRDTEYNHNFELTTVDGQWRINNPGEGILMSRQRFQQAFQPVSVYFLSSAGSRLVPQQVFLRQAEFGSSAPDALVRAVIRGPGVWLRPAVLNALPDDVASSGTWVGDDGIARLALSEEIEALSADQRVQAAAQLLFTLSYFESIKGLQINVNNRPLSIPGADDDGIIGFGALSGYNPERPRAPRDLYAIQGSGIVRLPEVAGTAAVALPGPLGAGWDQQPGRLAVSWQGTLVGVVNSDGTNLYRAATIDGEPVEVYHGSALAKPQFDSAGRLWTLDNTADGVVAVQVPQQGTPLLVPIPEIGGGQVLSFRISPDLTRMAVIVQNGQTQQLGLLRLRGSDQGTIDGWRELPLNTAAGQIVAFGDVAFLSLGKMMVLGASERDAQLSVYSFDVDAAQVTSQGPLRDVDVVALTAMPLDGTVAAAVVTSTRLALRYEAQYRWEELLGDVSDAAYPS